MYSKQEASAIRQKFWTTFGQYMSPVPSASGEKINWINYKTGVRSIQVKMDVTSAAYIAIEISDKDKERQLKLYQHLFNVKDELGESRGWLWEEHADHDGKITSRVYCMLNNVNVFKESDWPAIISFLKSHIITIDEFWVNQKDVFEMIG